MPPELLIVATILTTLAEMQTDSKPEPVSTAFIYAGLMQHRVGMVAFQSALSALSESGWVIHKNHGVTITTAGREFAKQILQQAQLKSVTQSELSQ